MGLIKVLDLFLFSYNFGFFIFFLMFENQVSKKIII